MRTYSENKNDVDTTSGGVADFAFAFGLGVVGFLFLGAIVAMVML